jgi:plasmid replication initiation protein
MQEVPIDKMIVVKHNDLIDAAQKLSIVESRIILTCISRINSKEVLDPGKKFTLTVSDIADLVGIKSGNAYTDLEDAVERLYHREVVFLRPSKRIDKIRVRWVSQIAYIPKEGTIELYFTPGIVKLLSDISRDFTQYKLENVLKFKSSYGLRFYELVCRWGGKTKTIELEELKEQLQLEGSYERWGNFKDWVLEPSIADINESSNVKISWEGIKRGKSIRAVKFEYKFDTQIKAVKEPTKMKPHQQPNNLNHIGSILGERVFGVLKSDIQKLANPGEDWFIAAKRIKKQQAELKKRGEPTLDVKW